MTKKDSNLDYESPCWGHNCDKYREVEVLHQEATKLIEANNKEVLPYAFFLREMGLKRSTPQHWRECRPLNLKILEDIKMYCDETLFHSIKTDPKLVFKYWELTRDEENQEVTISVKEDFLSTEAFGDDGEFNKKG